MHASNSPEQMYTDGEREDEDETEKNMQTKRSKENRKSNHKIFINSFCLSASQPLPSKSKLHTNLTMYLYIYNSSDTSSGKHTVHL